MQPPWRSINSDAYQVARQVRLRSSTASVLAMDGVSDS
jgi:hypothetical protein